MYRASRDKNLFMHPPVDRPILRTVCVRMLEFSSRLALIQKKLAFRAVLLLFIDPPILRTDCTRMFEIGAWMTRFRRIAHGCLSLARE